MKGPIDHIRTNLGTLCGCLARRYPTPRMTLAVILARAHATRGVQSP